MSGQKPITSGSAPAGPPPVDFSNVQGDIISGIPKKAQAFFFYQITDVKGFKSALTKFIPSIATEASVAKGRKAIDDHKKSGGSDLLDLRYTTVAFSSKGLIQLGIKDDIQDSLFTAGQLADSQSLGDKGITNPSGAFEPDWLFPFKHDIHGVISVFGSSTQIVQLELGNVLGKFKGTYREVYRVLGNVRPGDQSGHEHFGFLDGVSNPAITGLSTPFPGDDFVPPGIILLGRDGDTTDTGNPRPSWTLDSSILAFRLLNQLVPEFNKFLVDNALKTSDKSVSGSELLGARIVGRWKSGAPIAKAPTKDDPALGADPQHRNDFDFDPQSQVNCPFAAHIRKVYPRKDFPKEGGEAFDVPHRIIRRGIAFGPEVTPAEKTSQKTVYDRGLLFVNYQSKLSQGFHFLQESWANNPGFPFERDETGTPGYDPIIGQNSFGTNDVGPRSMLGTNPASTLDSLNLTAEWVVPKGGEYFISPSISALKGTIAA